MISPTPWSVRVLNDTVGKSVSILDARGGVVALMKHGGGRKEENANAIVEAMNGASK